MPANSEILLPSTTHPFTPGPITYIGDSFKGDGYYGWGDGSHTIQIETNGFIGNIIIQGSLATSPGDGDWINLPLLYQDLFSVDTTGLVSKRSTSGIITYNTSNTSITSYNFIGNFVWVRAVLTNWTDGSINKILFNH